MLYGYVLNYLYFVFNPQEILLSGVLALFFFVSGIIVLVKANKACAFAFCVDFTRKNVAETCGAFCFFCTVVYAVDVFFAFKIETE